MRNAFIRGLTCWAEQDERVILLTGDLGYRIFDDFAKRFAGRFLNMGTAEANMIGVAAGLALDGWRPIAYSIAPFATLRCLEQIRDDICYNHLPVAIVGVGGGFAYGPNGPTHHAIEDIAVMRALPNMTVVCPGDPVETELAVRAVASRDGPIYLRLGRAGDPQVHGEPPDFRIGQAIPVRQGTDVSLISTGGMLPEAVEIARWLESQTCSCGVLSMHTVKPLDTAALDACCRQAPVLATLEEHSTVGGLGSAVAEWLAASRYDHRLSIYGIQDVFARVTGRQAYLRQCHGLSAEQIATDILRRRGKYENC